MKTTPLVIVAVLIIGLGVGYVSRDLFGGTMPGGIVQNIDQHFIEEMIPHHEGAIEMATLALERPTSDDILSLSRTIIDAQTREIVDMKRWYLEWFGTEVSESSSMMGMGHGAMGHMQGMEGDMEALENAADFDQEFLSQMIVHHEMAVMMARMLSVGTTRTEMQGLADQIITSQNREIAMMESWLTAQQ